MGRLSTQTKLLLKARIEKTVSKRGKMKLDSKLIEAAISYTQKRFPDVPGAGAAAMYTSAGELLISTAPGVVSSSVELSHEVGAICEAYKLDQKVTATVCVSRDEKGQFHILTPCGVCQERLMFWSDEIECAVPSQKDSTKWEMRTLKELQPYYWRKPFKKMMGETSNSG